MTNLPSIDGKKFIKALRKAGFEVIRIKGSHHFLSPRRTNDSNSGTQQGNSRNRINSKDSEGL